MIVLFTCPSCSSQIEGDAELGGGTAQCPGCFETILVPAAGISEGTELAGYRIERLLGCGGMGEVFLATQLAMDRQVALKVLPPAMTRSRDAVDRFLHEVRMAAKLEHSNIVTAFDAGEDAGYYYLAMSFVEGEDLHDRLDREGKLPERDALIIALDIAEALSYAWRKHSILHRDIKPANIMIDISGEVKLMDMGIAKSIAEDSNLTMAGMFVGTPFYMSPEQCKAASDLDCRSDIYSLGATLYHLLTGEKPFTAPNSMAVLAAHLTEPLPSPLRTTPGLAPATVHVIARMMAKDRNRRYADWPELIADLRLILAEVSPNDLALPPLPDPLPVGGRNAQEAPPPTLVSQLAQRTPKRLGLPPIADDNSPPSPAGRKTGTTSGNAPPARKPPDSVPGLKPAARAAEQAAPPVSPARAETPGELPPPRGDDPPPAFGFSASTRMWSKVAAVCVVLAVAYFVISGSIFSFNSINRDRDDRARAAIDQQARNERETAAAVEGAIAHQQTKTEIAARAQEQDRRIQEMVEAAEAFATANPNDLPATLEQFRTVRPYAEGTRFLLDVDTRIRQLESQLADAPAVLVADLRQRGDRLAAAWKFGAAGTLCDGYKGPLAEATAAQRRELAAGYRASAALLDAALQVTDPLIDSIYNLDITGLQNAIVDIEKRPDWQKSPYFPQAAAAGRAVLDRAGAFMQSFQPEIGRELPLTVDGQETPWRIRGISDFALRADLNGRSQALVLSQFSAKEILSRLPDDDSDGYRLIKAVLAARAGRYDVAGKLIDKFPDGLLARAVAGRFLHLNLAGDWRNGLGAELQLTDNSFALLVGGRRATGSSRIFADQLLIFDGARTIRDRWNLNYDSTAGSVTVVTNAGETITFRRK